uniref:Family with sequence similarity 234 member B n=1 Tax=Cyprinus carpio TaxID=7962 RepID=A0A8C1NHX6_CYPCA
CLHALSETLFSVCKKGSDLGEYDPLTQADSEDETEDDDLVLNYPRNGLNPAVVGPGRSQGGAAEEKAARVRGAMRSAAFLLPLSCAALLVLLCAFLIPCPQGALLQMQWERELGDTAGVTSPPIALWDVDGDGLEDVLIAVTNISNDSQPMSAQSKELSVWALGGGGGQMLWRKSLREPLISVQCGLQTGSSDPLHSSACVLISSGHMIAINASTGWTLWTTAVGHVVSHAVLLPDLQGDAFPDLLIATLPEDKVSDLALVLISGRSGALIGRPVNFNLTAQGKLIGPLLHETQTGAYYVMFGLGTVEAVSLSLIYSRATGQTAASRCLCDPQVQIMDGARGRSLWEAEFVCPRLAVEDSSVLTASGQSVFLFWAGDPLAQPQNVSKVAEPVLRKLFLLHPNYPTILLELSSTTDTVLSAAGEPHPHTHTGQSVLASGSRDQG